MTEHFRQVVEHLHVHQVLELLAYAAGFRLYLHLRRRWPGGPKLDHWQTAWIVIGAIFGALIGAKALAWAETYHFYWDHRADWHIFLGGKTIVGALLGGWVGVEIAKRRLRISHPSGDVYVFPMILGMGIGRVGCFLEGLDDYTYGIPTSLPWGVDFGDGIRRHPTQLYDIAFLAALAGFFLWRIRSRRQRGCMFSQFVFAYLAYRFAVEFLKPRDICQPLPVVHLSAIQVTALAGMGYACWHWNDQCCGGPVPGGQTRRAPDTQDEPAPPATASAAACCGIGADGGARAALDAGPTFLELTNSLCPHCLAKVEAKVLIEAGNVYLQKFCPEHGSQRVLIADDAAYWRRARSLSNRPGTPPQRRNTPRQRGCPWDCGLCPDHEQHSCLAIVEVTDRCDMACPICYAAAGPAGRHRTLAEVEFMLDAVVANEGRVGVVQLSGGEPTLHPQFWEVLDAARARPIQHLMLNTNGRRLAEDPGFARRLASYQPRFEVYLQFDSLHPDTLRQLRGSDVSALRLRALEALHRENISTTLVMTLMKGVNDQEIGAVLEFAAGQKCVRGVALQPIQGAGRLTGFDPARHRLTLTEVRRELLRQQNIFGPRDLIPVPCHGDALALGYAIRRGTSVIPLSKLADPQTLIDRGGNTICYEQDPALRAYVQRLAASRAFPPAGPTLAALAQSLKLGTCLPLLPQEGSPIGYESVFRVVIMQFMDAWSMDLRSLKRSCVHIVAPDGRLIPFETYNLLYRHAGPAAAGAGHTRDHAPLSGGT